MPENKAPDENCKFCNGYGKIRYEYRGEYCNDIAEDICPCSDPQYIRTTASDPALKAVGLMRVENLKEIFENILTQSRLGLFMHSEYHLGEITREIEILLGKK